MKLRILGTALLVLVVALAVGCGGDDDGATSGTCGAPSCGNAAQILLCCRASSSPLVGHDECAFEGFDVEDECGTPNTSECTGEPDFVPPAAESCSPGCRDSRCAAARLASYCCGSGHWDSGACDDREPVDDVCPEGCPSETISTLSRDCCVSESTHCGPRPSFVVTEP